VAGAGVSSATREMAGGGGHGGTELDACWRRR
jgi:hypothetical protein